MRTICIRLCDNDFGSTFRNLLETLYNVFIYSPPESPEIVEKIIREGLRFHYIAFQNQYDYSNRADKDIEEHFKDIEKYLSDIKIYFDDEAEKFIQEHDHDGGSWYLEVQTGKVYSF